MTSRTIQEKKSPLAQAEEIFSRASQLIESQRLPEKWNEENLAEKTSYKRQLQYIPTSHRYLILPALT